jgi:Uma2 family endonuclease
MNSVTQQSMTAGELWHSAQNRANYELIDGEVVETIPPGGSHGVIAVTIAMLLRIWLKQHGQGYVGVESGFVLKRGPDTVRGPDVYYVRAERMPLGSVPEGFWEIVPDLAVEVISPSESAEDVRAKVSDFLAAGTPMVWVVYPRLRQVVVHLPDGTAQTYNAHSTLTAPTILPKFSCTVGELFA